MRESEEFYVLSVFRLSSFLYSTRVKVSPQISADRNQLLVTVVTCVIDLIAMLVKLTIVKLEIERRLKLKLSLLYRKIYLYNISRDGI